jgi:diguanylate cyclase (GGDEF)-like protein
MSKRDKIVGLEPMPRSSSALFDEGGVVHSWTPAFADNWSPSGGSLAGRTITAFFPQVDARRWAEIWDSITLNGVERLCSQPSEVGDHLEFIEVEVCKLLGASGHLAKVEARRIDSTKTPLRILQQEILEAMASGVALPEIMKLLCLRAEAMAPSVICSVLTVDRQGRLHHLASPSLPDEYSAAIDGVMIGPNVGSCGTAAFRGEPVEVVDIATDPLWASYKELALPLGLRACWSSPIKSSRGPVLGAFAFYFREPRRPSVLEQQIVATCLHLCTIALEHEETRQRIYDFATHDSLTRLANRIRFQQRVSEGLAIAGRTGQQLAILYVGLDHFRSINDTMGYANGDEVLRMTATRLQQIVRDGEMVARIGGDEFAMLQLGNLDAQDAAERANEIMQSIGRPYDLRGQQLAIGASIGIVFAPGDGATADELMKNAALALRRVKELGRGAYFFYEKALNARMQARRKLESGLRIALAAGEIELHFQPIIDLETLEVCRAEALLRWFQDERGSIPPAEFIPVAEDCGLIVPLGAWAIEQACIAAASWPEHISVAVNLSPVQFERPGLVETVERALVVSGLHASRLELEITESVLLHDNARNLATLDRLGELGVAIALDDFGTGYSSLSYLQRFAFDRIKIDHSFITSINRNSGSLKIVRSIVMLAHSLGLMVTAEGVETDEQFDAVRGEGCDDVQGFYVGRPQPLEAFQRSLTDPGVARAARAAN